MRKRAACVNINRGPLKLKYVAFLVFVEVSVVAGIMIPIDPTSGLNELLFINE